MNKISDYYHFCIDIQILTLVYTEWHPFTLKLPPDFRKVRELQILMLSYQFMTYHYTYFLYLIFTNCGSGR